MIRALSVALLMILTTTAAIGAPPRCNRVHIWALIQSQTDILETKVDLLVGKKNPTWNDFEALKTFRVSVETQIALARVLDGEPSLTEFYRDWEFASAEFAHLLKKAFDQSNLSDNYGPSDFALRKAFRDEFESIMELLPPNVRVKLNAIPADRNKAALVQEAKDIITQQEERVRELYPTSNYKNVTELVDTIRAKGAPEVKENLELLLNEDFEFAMRRPEGGRFWIPKVGFHNQHVTGRSKGNYSPEGRDRGEAGLLGVAKENYESRDNDLKPKYGFLMPPINKNIDRSNANQYGEDIYILNKDALRKRTTMTPGDSLGTGWRSYEALNAKPAAIPLHWDQAFIPWSQRALLAPTMQFDIYTNGVRPTRINSIEIGDGLKRFERNNSRSNAYVEMQYWGPVTLSEVVAFIFTQNPPTGEFLAALQKRNIKIYQQVNNKYVPWNPRGNGK